MRKAVQPVGTSGGEGQDVLAFPARTAALPKVVGVRLRVHLHGLYGGHPLLEARERRTGDAWQQGDQHHPGPHVQTGTAFPFHNPGLKAAHTM
ncbi:hypothetical protein DFI_14135 (plasmid) [Deinococcus ficus]|uniref:Uncharacterized protein n=1 Tax=Deinococcus ficus TaxID=317577 RepID=A0A221T0E3_9DEIO|nr:hypothetical protein DFI_14135 [Deinococcus ficus]